MPTHLTGIAFALLVAITTANAFAQQFQAICVVRELDEIEVPARRDGVIKELLVRRGTQVTEGQLFASLDQTDTRIKLAVANAELDQASMRAQNQGEVLTARAAVERAAQEQKLLMELGQNAVYLEKFRSHNSLQKANAEFATAENQLQQNRLQVEVKRQEAAVLENDLRQTKIVSPVNGIVRELKREQGEWVKQGEAVAVITRMDRLQAEGFLDSDKCGANSVIGATVSVTFDISGQKNLVLEGLIVEHTAPKLELDGKFPVWIEFDNRRVENGNGKQGWLIRPGMKARMTINLNGEAVARRVHNPQHLLVEQN